MLRQVKYFQAVVRCGSFTQAAEECCISQSAISQQIQALEQELGIQLLARRNRKFSVTPAGEYFYKKSMVWTADFEKLCRETLHIAHEDDPQLCIGYLKCYSGKEFYQAVAEFMEKYPDIAVHIINGSHEELYDDLRTGRVDLILSDQRRAFSDEYVNVILTTSECYIEIAGRSPIAEMESVSVQDLKDIPCILVASRGQHENEQGYYRDVVGIKGGIPVCGESGRGKAAGDRGQGFYAGGRGCRDSAVWHSPAPCAASKGHMADPEELLCFLEGR